MKQELRKSMSQRSNIEENKNNETNEESDEEDFNTSKLSKELRDKAKSIAQSKM